jgi:hypothetical protein
MVHVVRSPSWIVPPGLANLSRSKASSVLSEIELDENDNFTAAQVQKFKASPDDYMRFVKAVELETNQNFVKFVRLSSSSRGLNR